MNKVSLSSNLVCIKNSRPLILFDFEGQKLATILEINYIENQSYENMSLTKVGLTSLNSSMKKNQKDSVVLLIFKTKKNLDFLYTPSWS